MTRANGQTLDQDATLVAPSTKSGSQGLTREPVSIGHYKVLEQLGEGSMGRVFKCHDIELDRTVALKIISPQIASDTDCLRRFEREARASAKLTSPNTVRIYSIGRTRSYPFLVMEYVDGTSLQDHVKSNGRLEPEEALGIAKQVAQGMAAAHKAGLVHRDVKPSNILLPRDGEAKVADFGLAKPLAGDASLTTTGMVVGTPHYMSPEQAQGIELDHRSDIYSLGVTLYHMLAGTPPFSEGTPISIAMQHVQAPLPDLRQRLPGAPAEVLQLVQRMTAKDPAGRHDSWEEVLAALEQASRALQSEPIGEPSSRQRRAGKQHPSKLKAAPTRPRLRPRFLAVAVTCAVIAGVGLRYGLRVPPDGTKIAVEPQLTTLPETPVPTVEPPATTEPTTPPLGEAQYGFTRSYSMASPEELRDWRVTGFMGRGRPDKRLSLRHGQLDIPPRARTELWHNDILSGNKRITVSLRLDSLTRGNHLLLMFKDMASDERYLALMGHSAGGTLGQREPDLDRVDGPNNKLLRVGRQRSVLADNDSPILALGQHETITIEHSDGTLEVIKDGLPLLVGPAPTLADAAFGLGFPEGGALVTGITVEAGSRR